MSSVQSLSRVRLFTIPCDEHWGTRVSFSSGFLSVYAQQWDCWVIMQFYFQFSRCVIEGTGALAVQREKRQDALVDAFWL